MLTYSKTLAYDFTAINYKNWFVEELFRLDGFIIPSSGVAQSRRTTKIDNVNGLGGPPRWGRFVDNNATGGAPPRSAVEPLSQRK